MDDSADGSDKVSHRKARAAAWMRALRPAMPAVIGAAALTFLFAAVMPMAWVFGIGWNLYLDRLSDVFVPPVGTGARLALALGMALVAALIAAFVGTGSSFLAFAVIAVRIFIIYWEAFGGLFNTGLGLIGGGLLCLAFAALGWHLARRAGQPVEAAI